MTQKQIESLSHEEYCHLLSYGDPIRTDFEVMYSKTQLDIPDYYRTSDEPTFAWISTLDSTTYPDSTFGYHDNLPLQLTST